MSTPGPANPVDKRIALILADREHGAAFLAREAVRTMALAAQALYTGEEHLPALENVGRRLAQARPTMAAIKNMVERFIWHLQVGEYPEGILGLEHMLLGQMEAASQWVVTQAAELVHQNSRVLTCTYCSAIIGVIEAAMASGKTCTVLAVESMVLGNAFGAKVLNNLSALGVGGELVADTEIQTGVSSADMVLVGADGLFQDGSIINGSPTLQLALAAKDMIPVYVVGESFKVVAGPPAELEVGFDLVPSSLIARVITDSGP